MQFKKNLKLLREGHNISLSELGRKIQINNRVLETYEFRKTEPPFEALIKIADFYKVSIDYLISGNNNIFLNNLKLYSLATKMDAKSIQEIAKIVSYIEAFAEPTEKSNICLDALEYKFKNNFNHNFKILKEENELTETDIAKKISLSRRMVSSYTNDTECNYSTLVKISNEFSISIHWLLTGNKLFFNFKNKNFEQNITLADKQFNRKMISQTIEFLEKLLKK